IRSSPIVANQLVLVGSYDETLYALQEQTGKPVWTLETDGPVHATAAVQNGIVYFAGCDGDFRAVRLSDGAVLFAISLHSYVGASTVVEGDRAYVGTYAGEVIAVDLGNRKVVWRYKGKGDFPFYSSPVVDHGRVITGGRDRSVHAIDAADGHGVW